MSDPINPPGTAEPGQTLTGPEQAVAKGLVVAARVLERLADGQTKLLMNGRVVSAQVEALLRAGETVRLQVLETSPRLILAPLSSETAEPEAAPASPPQSGSGDAVPLVDAGRWGRAALKPGQIILARVAGEMKGGRVKLAPASQPLTEKAPLNRPDSPSRPVPPPAATISARLEKPETSVRLAPGQTARFEVVRTEPQLVVRPVAAPPTSEVNAAGQARVLPQLIGRPDETPALIRELQQLLTQARPDWGRAGDAAADKFLRLLEEASPRPAGPDDAFVPRLAGLLGLGGDRARLPEAAARLLSELVSSPHLDALKDHPGLKDLLETTVRLFEATERLGLLGQETAREDNSLFFSFPLFWPGQNGRGEMALKWPDPEQAGDEAQTYRVTFLLTMSRIGKIKADARVERKKLDVAFWAESPDVRDAIKSRLGRLEEALASRGFEVKNMGAGLFPPDRRPPDSLAEELMPAKSGLIDVKV